MSETISAAMIKETKDALSKYVTKPPLTEKLLRKPPFRYLHDIVSALIRETGFLDGLFTSEELDSNNVKDKESKIAFLDKLISAIKKATGKNITTRSAKIVAGMEVHKTLELMQIIGRAIDEKIDTTPIVAELIASKDTKSRKNTNNDEKGKKAKQLISGDLMKEPNKIIENSNALQNKRLSDKDNVSNCKNTVPKSNNLKKESFTEKIADNAKTKIKIVSNVEMKNKVPVRNGIMRNTGTNKPASIRRVSLKDSNRNVTDTSKPSQLKITKKAEENNDNVGEKINETTENNYKTERKNSLGEPENFPKNENVNFINDPMRENETYMRENVKEEIKTREKSSFKRRESASMPRPTSARPGSRKLSYDDQNKTAIDNVSVDNNEAKENEIKSRSSSSARPRTATRPASARPGAPRVRDRGEVSVIEEPNNTVGPVNVIEEGKQDHLIDDKDSFIVIETEKTPSQPNEVINVNESEQGQLVQQILKTQKELNESVVVDDTNQNKQLKIEWEAGRQREKDIVSEEVEKIRRSIQTLTSAANPLGKLFDFLQEDVDEMQRELQHWNTVNEKLLKQQASELELGKTLLEPLQKQLSGVENNIEEEYLHIANIKMTILNNDEKILKLATNNNYLKINNK